MKNDSVSSKCSALYTIIVEFSLFIRLLTLDRGLISAIAYARIL
jgi:hypothetical protein